MVTAIRPSEIARRLVTEAGRVPAKAEPVRLSDGRVLHVTHATVGGVRFEGPKGFSVIVSADDTPHGALTHVSVAYRDRLPSWRDLRIVKETFFGPDVAAAMILPEEAYFVNDHPFCLHLWEIPGGWKFNRTV